LSTENGVPAVRASRLGMVLAAARSHRRPCPRHEFPRGIPSAAPLGRWLVWQHRYVGLLLPDGVPEGNAAFFPGFPCCARLLTKATRLDQITALPVTAQLACAVFWAYLLLFFLRWGVRLRVAVFALLVVASHSAAFYLVVPDAESVFLAATVGYGD
jgi:hypothetical protein